MSKESIEFFMEVQYSPPYIFFRVYIIDYVEKTNLQVYETMFIRFLELDEPQLISFFLAGWVASY